MSAEKVVPERIRWLVRAHEDTARCRLVVHVPSRPSYNATLHLLAHVSRIPLKFSFSLVLGSTRVAGLDVNPGGSPLNLVAGKKESVWETHWQTWPKTEHADVDARDLSHREWLREFAGRHRIKLEGGYRAPPHFGGEQLRLL